MSLVTEVYNRVVQCQANQRVDRRGRRRRHLSDQTIKTETPSQSDAVQVRLELGHRAILRSRPTPEGLTHDWVVYVRGAEGSNIQHFVDKVKFHLHESFPKSKRVVKEPPYQVAETGYGGFTMPIDVYIKNNGEPKKIRFQYELFLGTVGTITHNRCEKITFQQPSPLFRERLVNGGAITPECAVLVPREGDESSSTGDSSESRYPTADPSVQIGVVHGLCSTRSASAPLPSLSECCDTDDWAYPSGVEFCTRPVTTTKVASAASETESGHGPSARPLSYLQRRLHCRVALSATHRLAPLPVCDHVPLRSAAADDRGTTNSDDVIVVSSGWTNDAKRAATKFQPKLEPGVHLSNVRDVSNFPSAQLTTVEQPRRVFLPSHPRDHVEPSRTATVAPSNIDQSTALRSAASAPRIQSQTVTTETCQNNELVVKRGRGRPRKYPPKSTVSKQQHKSTLPTTAKTAGLPSDPTRDRLICDKENISPRSSAVVAAKRNADQLDRNIWMSSAVRDAACTLKSFQASDATTKKVVGVHERQKLFELPVNVVLSDDNNNFPKKPSEKLTSNFWLKDIDKDKLLSVWNALKGTLQSDDFESKNRRDEVGDSIKCHTTELRGVTYEVKNGTTEHHQRPNEVPETPTLDARQTSNTKVTCQQAAVKTVHWKYAETDDVGRPDIKVQNAKVSDEPSAADLQRTSRPFIDDFDDKLPLLESLGKPLFTSTPIKLTDAATTASSAAVPAKRARVKFRPVTQARDVDDEDAADRVELSKLAALPSMQQGAGSSATQISGVRPADIVRAFRTIDNVTAAATSTLALQSHGTSHTLPFVVPSQTPTELCQPPIIERMINAYQPVVSDASSPATVTTSSSTDASPSPCEIVPGQLLHFYGAQYDGQPYNLSPSSGGFVTKAARKRPIIDDLDIPDRKRFQPDVPASAVSTSHVAENVVAPTSVRQSSTSGVLMRPEISRSAGGTQCRPVAEMTSSREVRRAPNGVLVDELLRLQRQLSMVSDAATLRQVVHIIGETGQYFVNDVTFDFDLCKLDSTTVARLIHCLEAAVAK